VTVRRDRQPPGIAGGAPFTSFARVNRQRGAPSPCRANRGDGRSNGIHARCRRRHDRHDDVRGLGDTNGAIGDHDRCAAHVAAIGGDGDGDRARPGSRGSGCHRHPRRVASRSPGAAGNRGDVDARRSSRRRKALIRGGQLEPTRRRLLSYLGAHTVDDHVALSGGRRRVGSDINLDLSRPLSGRGRQPAYPVGLRRRTPGALRLRADRDGGGGPGRIDGRCRRGDGDAALRQ